MTMMGGQIFVKFLSEKFFETQSQEPQMYENVGSEQALAPVRLPDTFAEGAWDKVPKTEGTFDFVFPTTIVHGFYKNYLGLFFVC